MQTIADMFLRGACAVLWGYTVFILRAHICAYQVTHLYGGFVKKAQAELQHHGDDGAVHVQNRTGSRG